MTEEEKLSENPFGADFEKQKGSLGTIWLPDEKGETLKGEVLAIEEIGDYGKSYLIKKDDNTEIRTPSHKVLQSGMNGAKVGDMVGIVYTHSELPTVKGRNPTRMYDVYIKGK